MKSLQTIALATLLTASAVIAQAATPLVNLIGDQAPLVISFNDVPSLVKNWGESPWAKTWNDPQMQKFFAPLRAKMDFDKLDEEMRSETGHTASELLGFATGDVLFALTTADFDFEAADAKKEAPFIFAVELGDNAAKVEKLFEEQRQKHPENSHETEEFAGVTLHLETMKSEGEEGGDGHAVWAITDGVLLGGLSKDAVVSAIDALKKGGAENAFGKSQTYLAAREKSGASQISVLVNFGVIIPRVQQVIAAKAAESPPSNPFLNPMAIIPALGLDAWNLMYFNVNFTEAQTTMTGGFTFSAERGLLKMFSYGQGPVAQPSFVPAKWITVSSAKFSLKSFYAGLEEMLGAYNPGVLGMGQMYVQQFNQQLGIDIKRDFFGSFGSDTVTAYAMRPGSSTEKPSALDELDQFIGFSLDNPKALLTALDALMKAGGPQAEQFVTKREYLGTTINTINMPAAPGQPRNTVSYAVAKNYLMISTGTPAALEAALQGGQSSFWDRSEVKRAFAQIPSDASTFTYQDTGALMGSVVQTFVKLAEAQPAKPDDVPFDASAKPDAATLAKYWGDAVGYITRDSQGYFFKSTLDHKK
jgi:hypothetical protein